MKIDATFKRLGISELGRHAFETRMPDKIFDIISKEDSSNSAYGVIPILRSLLEHSHDVEVAYLCTQHAVQVSKISNEGGHFCGYRNIQMVVLSLPPTDREKFASIKPTIPQIQDMIEKAWDEGINTHGRIQTGGVTDTRKHIGTSEAEAILLHHSVPCTGTAFNGPAAWLQLLDYVEAYFSSSPQTSRNTKIKQTDLAPMFLQRPHHSMTIVGIERTTSGKRRLLAFDPGWRPPAQITQPPIESCSRWSTYWTLKRYRRGERYLRRFEDFEALAVGHDPTSSNARKI